MRLTRIFISPLLALSVTFAGIQTAGAEELVPSPEPQTTQEFYEEGMKAMEAGDLETGIAYLEKARELSPQIAQLHNAVGIAYLQEQKNIDAALEAFQEAIALEPTLADAHNNLGIIYTGMLEDYDLAEEYFKEAIRLQPNFGRAYFGLGWLYLTRKKEPSLALEAFKKTIELSPDQTDAYYYLGIAYMLADQKPQTLTPITILKSKGKEDYAKALELMMEEDSQMIRSRFYEEDSARGQQEETEEALESADSNTSMVQL